MKTQHEIMMENPEFRKLLAVEGLTAEAAETIAKLMARQKVSKADLARRLGKSRAWVTQLLSGKTNMTVRTLAEVVFELGAEVKLHAQKSDTRALGGWQSIPLKVENCRLGTALQSSDLFRLGTHQLASLPDEADSLRPEFAA
jgi:transcriptional regulator with XRE-family HTH domain